MTRRDGTLICALSARSPSGSPRRPRAPPRVDASRGDAMASSRAPREVSAARPSVVPRARTSTRRRRPVREPTASPHLGDADSSGGDPTRPSQRPPPPPIPTPAAADEPEELTCPITRAMFRDPVFVAGSGNTYERAAIETFWRAPGPRRDPLTNAEFRRRDDARVFTNWDKRREVSAWLAKHPDRVPEGWPSRDVPPPIAPEDEPSRASRAAAANRRPVLFTAAAGVAAIATLAAAFVASTAAVRSDGVPPFVVAARNAERQRHERAAAKSTAARSTRSGSFESNAAERRTPNADASDSDAAYVATFAESAYAEMRRARPPAGSRVSVRRGDRGALEIVVPPQGIFNHKTVAEMGFAAAWSRSRARGRWARRGPRPGFALFSLPFSGVGAHLGFASARAALETTRLVFVPPEAGGAASKKGGEWGEEEKEEEEEGCVRRRSRMRSRALASGARFTCPRRCSGACSRRLGGRSRTSPASASSPTRTSTARRRRSSNSARASGRTRWGGGCTERSRRSSRERSGTRSGTRGGSSRETTDSNRETRRTSSRRASCEDGWGFPERRCKTKRPMPRKKYQYASSSANDAS